MKLGEIHATRIEAMSGCTEALAQVIGREAAVALVEQTQNVGRFLIHEAPDDSDPGRLTHSLDCLRGALDGLNHAIDIGSAKTKRPRTSEPAAATTAPVEQTK